MAKNININSLIHIILLVFSTLFISAQSQEIFRKSDDNRQQIETKVERINLKDFGFNTDKQTRTQSQIERQSPDRQREDDQRAKEVWTRSRIPPPRIPIPPRADPSFERRTPNLVSRDSVPRARDPFPNRVSYSGRRDTTDTRRSSFESTDKIPERDIPSPIDWSSNPRRVGLTYDTDLSARRAFDSSIGSSSIGAIREPNRRVPPRRQRKNCSEECLDTRYLQHYYAKGCKILNDYECNCAIGFDCPAYTSKNTSVCQYDGRTYQIGSRIPVRNPCRICECRDFGRRRGEAFAEIDCGISIECPEEAFGLKPEPNCYFAYDRDACCGHQVCASALQPKSEQKVCKYKEREYKLGQKIYPDEDPCKICRCTEDWHDDNFLTTGACSTYRCEFELDKDFKNGCLPIYHSGTCCPIEYKCPKNFPLVNQTSDSSQCLFDGRKYPIGSKLVTENICVDCVCRVPPDFTCVHKSCPTPPSNCYVGKWDNSVCCQQYICARPDHIRDESQFKANFYSPKN